MQAKIDSELTDDQLTVLRSQLQKVIFSPALQVPAGQEETERFCFNKERVTKNLKDIFSKQTERFSSKSHIQSLIVLSEHNSPSEKRESNWQFEEGTNQQEEGDIQGIETLLEREGLLQVFNCFQVFRNVLIESLSQSEGGYTTRAKVDLLQAISHLKSELLKVKNIEQVQQISLISHSFDGDQMKSLLSKISALRRENDKLKKQIQLLKSSLLKIENTEQSLQNSIVNNSYSYANSSLCSGMESRLEESFEVGEEKIKGIPSDLFKMGSKSTTISLGNSIRQQGESNIVENVLQTSQYLAQESLQCSRISLCQGNQRGVMSDVAELLFNHRKQQWYSLINQCIKVIKVIFGSQVQASNLALFQLNKTDEIDAVVRSYKSFKADLEQKSQKTYMRESLRLIRFTQDHSLKLSLMVGDVLKRIKRCKK